MSELSRIIEAKITGQYDLIEYVRLPMGLAGFYCRPPLLNGPLAVIG